MPGPHRRTGGPTGKHKAVVLSTHKSARPESTQPVAKDTATHTASRAEDTFQALSECKSFLLSPTLDSSLPVASSLEVLSRDTS